MPRPEALGAGAVAELMGGFSYKPTKPPRPSAFFNAGIWSSVPGDLLPTYPSQELRPARYYIELRIVHPSSRRLLATYY